MALMLAVILWGKKGLKLWERPWSMTELRTGAKNGWTLAADAGVRFAKVYCLLKKFSSVFALLATVFR